MLDSDPFPFLKTSFNYFRFAILFTCTKAASALHLRISIKILSRWQDDEEDFVVAETYEL